MGASRCMAVTVTNSRQCSVVAVTLLAQRDRLQHHAFLSIRQLGQLVDNQLHYSRPPELPGPSRSSSLNGTSSPTPPPSPAEVSDSSACLASGGLAASISANTIFDACFSSSVIT